MSQFHTIAFNLWRLSSESYCECSDYEVLISHPSLCGVGPVLWWMSSTEKEELQWERLSSWFRSVLGGLVPLLCALKDKTPQHISLNTHILWEIRTTCHPVRLFWFHLDCWSRSCSNHPRSSLTLLQRNDPQGLALRDSGLGDWSAVPSPLEEMENVQVLSARVKFGKFTDTLWIIVHLAFLAKES